MVAQYQKEIEPFDFDPNQMILGLLNISPAVYKCLSDETAGTLKEIANAFVDPLNTLYQRACDVKNVDGIEKSSVVSDITGIQHIVALTYTEFGPVALNKIIEANENQALKEKTTSS